MRARTLLSPSLADLISTQAGVIGRAQLLAAGTHSKAIERLLAEGFLSILVPGIYTRGGDPPFLARAWAGILLGGDHAVLARESAAFLHGLAHAEPDLITVYAPQKRADRSGWRFIRRTAQGRGEPARTTVEVTTIDLCDGLDEDESAALLANAISSRKTTQQRLREELQRRPRVANRQLLREILVDAGSGAHSPLERRYMIHVERAHGLPVAVRQAQSHSKHRSDAWYEDFGLLVELDSKLHHSGGAAFRDMSRDNDHALLGLTTLRLGWAHVTGSGACETARLVARALMQRGWQGTPEACARCRSVPW